MLFRCAALLLVSLWPFSLAAQTVIEDGGVGISKQELEYLVKLWTPQMQEAAANDLGDRLELLNMALTNKKIADEANQWTPENNPDEYWRFQFFVRNELREYVVNKALRDIVVPDMTELSKERYETEKVKYANVAEQRYVSHILIICQPPDCERASRRPLAEKVMAELKAGEPFSALVETYSEDTASKARGGRVDRWLKLGDNKIDRYFLQSAFEIEKVGDYSAIVESNFGFHIIRLDEIRPQHLANYEEAAPTIISDLEVEYRKLAAKEFDAKYRVSDEAYIDGAAMEEIFAPYKTEASAPAPTKP